jgi:hypothetical protein
MPTPLVVKRPPEGSPLVQVLAFVLIGVPLLALWFCWHQHLQIHFGNPWLNLAAHAALVVLPLIWVGMMFHMKINYESRDGETILAECSFVDKWPVEWWQVFLLLATGVVTVVTLGHSLFIGWAHPESLSTPPWKALVIMAVMTFLGMFYATIFLSKSEPAVWISDEGLRTSVMRFHQWDRIDHFARRGNRYLFYHRVNPALPLFSVKLREHETQAILERQLSKHAIRMADDEAPVLLLVKAGVVLGFLGNVGLCLWLRFDQSFSFLTVVVISAALAVILSLMLERFRGVSKYGKYKPIMEATPEEIGDAPKPIV